MEDKPVSKAYSRVLEALEGDLHPSSLASMMEFFPGWNTVVGHSPVLETR